MITLEKQTYIGEQLQCIWPNKKDIFDWNEKDLRHIYVDVSVCVFSFLKVLILQEWQWINWSSKDASQSYIKRT